MYGKMRKRIHLMVVLWMGGMLLAMAGSGDRTPYTLQQVQQVYPTLPDSALYMLEMMEEHGWERPWFIEAQRACVHYENGHYLLAVECAKKAVAQDSLRRYPGPYMKTVVCCVKSLHQLNEWDECLRLLNYGIGYARRHGNTEVEKDLLYVMGRTYYHWGQRSESYRFIYDPLVRRLVLAGFVLLLLLLCAALFHLYRILQKNKQIADQQHRSVQQEAQIALLEQQVEIHQSAAEASEEGATETERVDYALYLKLEKLMHEELLYLRSDLSRQDLLDLLVIDKNRFAHLMQTYVKQTLPQYLTELRIQHALREFREHPQFTVQAVAEGSGFANLRHFQRAFKQATGMTPTEYKLSVTPPPHTCF